MKGMTNRLEDLMRLFVKRQKLSPIVEAGMVEYLTSKTLEVSSCTRNPEDLYDFVVGFVDKVSDSTRNFHSSSIFDDDVTDFLHSIDVRYDGNGAFPRKRDFGRNPLKFYLDRVEIYGGMSRSKLELFDEGLYRSLRRYSQIDIAIPKVLRTIEREPISKEKFGLIILTYVKCGRNARRTSKILQIPRTTVRKYVVKARENLGIES